MSIIFKVVAFTLRIPGHYSPFIPVLDGLQKRGHQVLLVLCTRGSECPAFGDVGVRTEEWNYPALSTAASSSRSSIESRFSGFVAYGESTAKIVEKVIREEQPAMLLLDPILWGGMIAAEASGIPWATLAHNPLFFRGSGLDVRGPGLPPARTTLQRLWHRMVAAAVRENNACMLPIHNRVRLSRNLAPLEDVLDAYLRPPLIIATTAEPFEYPRVDWPSSLRFVGPLYWDPPSDGRLFDFQRNEQPLVLLVGSSVREVGKARSWVETALRTLANEDIQLIATVPTDHIPSGLPPHVRVERFIPHELLLPLASSVVCHGGPGITHKALAAGVPVVAVPFAYDRFEIARRVEVSKAGVMLPGRLLSPSRLRTALRRSFDCRAGAENVAQAFRSAGGVAKAVESIEDCIRSW